MAAMSLHGWRRDRKCPANSAHPWKPKEDLDRAQMLTNLFTYMDPIRIRFLEFYPLNLINDIYTHTDTVRTANANMVPGHHNKSGIQKMRQYRKHHFIATP